MINKELLEYKDLTREEKRKVVKGMLDDTIEFQLADLYNNGLDDDIIYKTIGCSKYYAESTSWFVPSVYFEHNYRTVYREVLLNIRDRLYSRNDYIEKL